MPPISSIKMATTFASHSFQMLYQECFFFFIKNTLLFHKGQSLNSELVIAQILQVANRID